jgi:hypothetical protein
MISPRRPSKLGPDGFTDNQRQVLAVAERLAPEGGPLSYVAIGRELGLNRHDVGSIARCLRRRGAWRWPSVDTVGKHPLYGPDGLTDNQRRLLAAAERLAPEGGRLLDCDVAREAGIERKTAGMSIRTLRRRKLWRWDPGDVYRQRAAILARARAELERRVGRQVSTLIARDAEGFTDRERLVREAVFALVAEGLRPTDQRLSDRLGLSTSNVGRYRRELVARGLWPPEELIPVEDDPPPSLVARVEKMKLDLRFQHLMSMRRVIGADSRRRTRAAVRCPLNGGRRWNGEVLS